MQSGQVLLKRTKRTTLAMLPAVFALMLLNGMPPLHAQDTTSAKASAQRSSGTVKSVSGQGFVLTTAAGQDVTVSVPEGSRVLVVAPGSKDLSSAKPGAVSDIEAGDRALVTAAPGEAAGEVRATRVVLMKSGDLAATRAADESAWSQGVGGIVKSSTPDGTLVVSSGLKTVSVTTSPATQVKRYAAGSIKFQDATPSSLTAIQAGDQIRVRGQKAADGASIAADAIIAGSFRNYSGTIQSIDSAAGTLTLKDLTTKKVVSVAVTANSDLRALPPQAAAMMAGRLRNNGATGGAAAAQPAGAPSGANRGPGPTSGAGASGPPSAEGAGPARTQGARSGMDLSQMLSRLPTQTLNDLKAGEAVMIVASSPTGQGAASAITLLSGVEPILAAPAGETMTLSPWSVGSGGAEGMAGGATP